MKHLLLLFLFIVCCRLISTGQPPSPPGKVQGRVVSFLEKQALVGVNVMISGTSRGVITEVDGSFSLEATPSDTLIFSYVGYETVEIPVLGQTYFAIELIEDISLLKEIEVFSTGYQQVPKERATGSFAHVDNELLNRSVSTDVIGRIKDITPALYVDERSGTPTLSIRGQSTLFGNARPLIVVDNFPYDGDLSNINPNDIEHITVLKDAAAASIWGVRAGNGVIVITTKSGKLNRPMQVNLNANVTVGKRPDLFYEPVMEPSEFISVERFLFEQGFYDADLNNAVNPPALSPVVELLAAARNGDISTSEANAQINALEALDVRQDLEEHFYQPGINQQYALNLNGGSAQHTWYVSGGYDRNRSHRAGNSYERVNLSTQQTFELLPRLELQAGLFYTNSTTETDLTLTHLLSGKGIYPYASLSDEIGRPLAVVRDYRTSFVQQASGNGLLDWSYVPLEEPEHTENTTLLSDVRATTGLNYTLFEGLNAEVKYQYEKQLSGNHTEYDEQAWFTRDQINRYSTVTDSDIVRNVPLGSILDKTNVSLVSHNVRAQLNYALSRQRHDLNLLIGMDVREERTEGFRNRYYGYDPNTGLSQAVNYLAYYQLYPSGSWALIPRIDHITGTIDRFRSWYGHAAYSYDHRYTLTLSGRIDQSNLFGVKTNQRSVPLWSAGGKWNLSGEGWYGISWLPVLEFRATYGYSGNLDQGVTAFTTMRYATDGLTGKQRADILSPPNPELRWEKTGMLNLAMDFQVVDELFSGSIEYYHKKGTDLIGDSPLDPTSGLSGFRGNVADMEGQGIDLVLKAIPINRRLKWQSDLIFSYTQDKITTYQQEPPSIARYFRDASLSGSRFDLTPTEGKPLYGLYSYAWAGIDPQTGDPLGYLDGESSNNYAAMQSAATFDSLVFHGTVLPPVFGAWRNTFSYKGFSISVNITWKLGHYFRRPSINYSSMYNSYYGHSDYALRWQQSGDDTQVPSQVYPANAARDDFYQHASVLVEKADHIRLQDIQLSYDLGSGSRSSFREMQVYVYASNLGILWRANDHGIDPDYNINRSVQTGTPVFPQPASMAIGIKAGF